VKKVLLFGTAILVATSVFAFGGGGKNTKRSIYHGRGVDSVGVRFGGKNGTTEQKITCPEERKCGDVCCGEGNVCDVESGLCCFKDYNGDKSMCCSPDESVGYGSEVKSCCLGNAKPYIYYLLEDGEMATDCCAGTVVDIAKGIDWFVQSCCDHEPDNYTNSRGEVFKVCWNEETECKTNEQCAEIYGDGYFCNVKDDTEVGCLPNGGKCEPIGSGETANIVGLGEVLKSDDHNMTWWAADNWCKAQGKSLISIEKFGCYYSGTNDLMTENNDQWGYCCKGNGAECKDWGNYWTHWYSDTLQPSSEELVYNSYSATIISLRQVFGNAPIFWTASSYSLNDSCARIGITLHGSYTFDGYLADPNISALCQ